MEASQVQAIQWPTMPVGGQTRTLRVSYSAYVQLAHWKYDLAKLNEVPLIAWAAASMGTFDAAGKWHSTAWDKPLDLADALLPEETEALAPTVLEALKKAAPGATIEAQPLPATEAQPN